MALLEKHRDDKGVILMTVEEHDHLIPIERRMADILIGEGRARIVDEIEA